MVLEGCTIWAWDGDVLVPIQRNREAETAVTIHEFACGFRRTCLICQFV